MEIKKGSRNGSKKGSKANLLPKLILFLICSLLLSPAGVLAQDTGTLRGIYTRAEQEFQIGRIEQATEMLRQNINSFQGNLKESAYRLLSLCYLSLDLPQEAEQCASELLDEDPYYNPSPQDPQRFVDIIEDIKAGRSATITTASNQAETLSEVPVPTTLITEEMIRNSGATNLQEVLAAYVPGMNIVDCNDDINIAMRGIYSNGQEKILIMLNGHRLNSYCTNIAAPDFSISLEKLKQIEVLRGPASSLYGGVALTAVVNLITKQGVDADGFSVKAAGGNYGQFRGDILFGKRYFDLDLLVWGSLYRADGQKMDVPEERFDEDIYGMREKEITIGQIGNKPSYDFGVNLNYKGLKFLYDTQFSQVVAPFTISTLAKSYAHDKYKTFNGIKPSYATQSHHVNMSYGGQLGPFTLRGTVLYDNSDLTHYQVISDLSIAELASIMGIDASSSDNPFAQEGIFRYINGQEQNYGIQLKGDVGYVNTAAHRGSVAFGTEYSHFKLEDVRYAIGNNYSNTLPESQLVPENGTGSENSYNAFLQLKHKWKSLILNAGLRYDHKQRTNDYTVNEFSPRIALILLQKKWNLKLSYSKSFVDAPYLYRKTNQLLPMLVKSASTEYYNYTTLMPEAVRSLQLTFSAIDWIKGLTMELNGFYNNADDLIITHIIDHENSGKNKTAGIELQSFYNNNKARLTVDFNATWTKTFRSNLFIRDIDANNNTPALMGNLVVSYKPLPRLRLHAHLNAESRQTTYNQNVVQLIFYDQLLGNYREAVLEENEELANSWFELLQKTYNTLILEREMPARAILNLGADYQLGGVNLGFNVRNVLNTKYDRSGMNTKLVPQRGRWFTVSVAYKF